MDNALYTDEEFTTLCEQIRDLKPGGVVVIDRRLRPEQLQALDDNRNFVVIAGTDRSQFYCIALVDDLERALRKSVELIANRGGDVTH